MLAEQAKRRVAIRYLTINASFATALRAQCADLGTIHLMSPAEGELRKDLEALVQEALLKLLPNEGWLTSRRQFERSQREKSPPWRMDAFYRFVRRDTGILMEDGKPAGGKFSFDAENRLPGHGTLLRRIYQVLTRMRSRKRSRH